MPKFLDPIKFGGRRRQATAGATTGDTLPTPDTRVTEPRVYAPSVDRARVVLDSAQRRASEAVRVVNIPTANRPTLRAAAHTFGSDVIDGPTFEQAYRAFELAPEILYGFGAEDLVPANRTPDAKVPFHRVSTPEEAFSRWGMNDRAEVEGPTEDIAIALENAQRSMAWELIRRIALGVLALGLRLIAKALRKTAAAVKNAVGVRIPVIKRTVSLGGPFAAVFEKIAEAFEKLADKLEDQFDNVERLETPRPPGTEQPDMPTGDEEGEGWEVNAQDIDIDDIELPNSRTPQTNGVGILTDAHTILRTVEDESSRRSIEGDDSWTVALQYYDRVRLGRRGLSRLERARDTWGPQIPELRTRIQDAAEGRPVSPAFRLPCDPPTL